jgi:hypothetical protein
MKGFSLFKKGVPMYFASYDDKEIARLGLTLNDAYFLEWFINFKDSEKMNRLSESLNKDKEHDYYWITYSKIIKDLPLLYIKNNTSINNMLNRLCGKGKSNSYSYPLIRQKVNINMVNRSFIAIRPEVIAKMKGIGFTEELGIAKIPKIEKKDSICSLSPNVEKILIELDKLKLLDNRKLFSFTLSTDHHIHTKSMKHFQDACYDLYEGRFNSRNPIAEWFLEKNQYYITNFTSKEICACKHDWNQIYNVILCAANNYISWFENDRETVNKEWLTRDIGSWMYFGLKQTSMFMVSIKCKASKTREVVAENTFNRLPDYIQNRFMDFYNDKWDNLTYWNKIYSVYKWYNDNAENLMLSNTNYSYWLDSGIEKFMQGYCDFINERCSPIYLKNFGTKCATWFWFLDTKKDEHGIEE